jgi:hypothetical protein
MKFIRFLMILLMVTLLTGISPQIKAQGRFKYDSTWSQWNIRLAPYFWLLGIKGEIDRPPPIVQLPEYPPVPVHPIESYGIDIGFKEFRNSLKFAFMLNGQFKKDWFVTQFNVSSFIIEGEAITPLDYIFQNNFINLAYVGGDLGAGYRVIRSEKLEFDALIGLKFVYTKIGITTDLLGKQALQGAYGHFWADPVLATNFLYRPIPRIELALYGDIGSTLLNTDLTYQFSGNVSFLVAKHFYLSVGYRNYYVKHPEDIAIFSGTLSGMITRFGFQF